MYLRLTGLVPTFAALVLAATLSLGPRDAHSQAASASPPPLPFAQQPMTLENGIEGRNLSFPSANPRNYEDILAGASMPPVTLEAKLYLPRAAGPVPAVIITPGSGGVNPSMLLHARALTDAGIAVLLIDPFGGRGVKDTISAQDQFSFAASTYDVFAAMRALEQQTSVDRTRLGAMGYSRGGVSVIQASITPLVQAALGPGKTLRAVVAGWPWCGYQFVDARTAPTALFLALGDIDNWVSPVQCQAYASAMKPLNPKVSLKLYRNADHGFGYTAPMREIANAIKALNAPVVYFDAQGRFLDIWTQAPQPGLDDTAILKLATPFVSRGVRLGTKEGQTAEFIADMTAFFKANLLP